MIPAYREGSDGKRYPGETIRGYLARRGMHRGAPWDHEHGGFRYPVHDWLDNRQDGTQEGLDHYAERLPLVVPGLEVVHTSLGRRRPDERLRGHVWFTWSEEAMWARIAQVFDQYGVADERLAYCECAGTIETPGGQQALPGVVDVETRVRGGMISCAGHPRYLYTAYTAWGLTLIESAFIQRIQHPDRGGPGTQSAGDRECLVGNEWWLVGTRGDSAEVMALEIRGSPLDDRVKENLLMNMGNYR